MLKYWSSIFGGFGIALAAASVFREDWRISFGAGIACVILGGFLYDLFLDSGGKHD
ncbi:MAG: hypothetical protein J5855_04385 [Mailhella sp.]|nr:hypothetical protein [Mailhella sp.]